ncbi:MULTISPECIES: hypothetical protein [Trichocoleus]|uniref:Uncharacterized protein n=1 Tax=Trichocoleus desertorum GB2-A4 TaxID=2933944 RepID=A0ABV0JDB6_9CYAN|nr:hypothetical protein [Trichocoleus sp. FACHB-46]MBD1864423.1 hypothetical protein [Trichocoleus sp. FACHB-46]
MKLLRKLASGFLLTWGFLFLIVPISVLPDKNASQEDRDQAIGCLVGGIPVTAWGVWLAYGLYRQREKEQRDRLQGIFYQLLKQGNGSVTVLELAMEAKLSGADAKQYLDAKAREFGATFDVTDRGSIAYEFDLKAVNLFEPASAPLNSEN